MATRAVLFDWDGTLVTKGDLSRSPVRMAAEELLRVCGIVIRPGDLQTALERVIPPYVPGSTLTVEPFPESLGHALRLLGHGLDAQVLEALARVVYRELSRGSRLFSDVAPALAALRRLGIAVGVVTNTNFPASFVWDEADRLGLSRYLDAIVASADVGLGKPHGAIFKKAIEMLGSSPGATVFVGDNPLTDIAGAQAAGLVAVLLTRDGDVPGPGCPMIRSLDEVEGTLWALPGM